MKSLSLSKKLCHFGPAVQTMSNSKCRFNQVDNSPCVMHVCLLHMYSIRGINNPHVITHHLYNWKNKQLHKTTKQTKKQMKAAILFFGCMCCMCGLVTSSPSQLLDAATQASLYLPMTTFSQVLVFS